MFPFARDPFWVPVFDPQPNHPENHPGGGGRGAGGPRDILAVLADNPVA